MTLLELNSSKADIKMYRLSQVLPSHLLFFRKTGILHTHIQKVKLVIFITQFSQKRQLT